MEVIDEYFADNRKDYIYEGDFYEFEGRNLPRVTRVIGTCKGDITGLLEWSNRLGFKRINYGKYMKEVTTIGTACHNAVENYINEKKEPDLGEFADPLVKDAVMNAFTGFKSYWDAFTTMHRVKKVYTELHIRTPWYAGTCDLIIEEENGTTTLCDFKTSNYVKDEHFLQLAAYKYGLEYPSAAPLIKVDSVCILHLNKKRPVCEEILLDLSIFQNQMFMEHCKNCFFSMLYTYYSYNIVKDDFNFIVPKGV